MSAPTPARIRVESEGRFHLVTDALELLLGGAKGGDSGNCVLLGGLGVPGRPLGSASGQRRRKHKCSCCSCKATERLAPLHLREDGRTYAHSFRGTLKPLDYGTAAGLPNLRGKHTSFGESNEQHCSRRHTQAKWRTDEPQQSWKLTEMRSGARASMLTEGRQEQKHQRTHQAKGPQWPRSWRACLGWDGLGENS
jgi:hypothetical protein